MTAIKKSLPFRLTEYRRLNRISQREMAERLGVPMSTYVKWEYGLRSPSPIVLRAIEAVLSGGRV